MTDLLREFRYAVRSLSRTPGFSLAAILILALGIGANTAIFSLFERVVLAPLPYHDPDRLVVLALYNRTLKFVSYLSYPDFLDWERMSRSFEHIAVFKREGFDLTSPGEPEHVDAMEVSSGFFVTLGDHLALGRDLSPDEDRAGGPPAVIISDRLWRDRFRASPGALGKAIRLNGAGYTVIGILRPGFRFGTEPADVYAALGRDPLYSMYRNDRTVHDIGAIGRLRPGVTRDEAQAEMNAVQDNIDAANPTTEHGLGTYVAPLKEFFIGDVDRTLFLLLGAVALVLLIACANVANLLLARSAARTRDFAIRLSLGASRAQITRHLIVESMLLALTGGTLGLAFSKAGVTLALAVLPGGVPRAGNIGLNASVLLFAFGMSILVALLFSLLPAMKASNTDVYSGLKEGGRNLAGAHHRTQRVLVIVQIAIAFVLLAACSLLFRTIHNLLAVNPGFDPQHVVTFQVGLSSTADTAAKIRTGYQDLLDRVRRIPAVQSADITALVPMGQGANEGPFWTGPHQPGSMAEIPRAIYYPVGPEYFRTMRIPLVRGRLLASTDTIDSELVIVIDTVLARTYFGDRDPVGQIITVPHWGAARNVPFRIAGVVGHVKHYGLGAPVAEKPQIYYCFYQLPNDAVPFFRAEVSLAVRMAAGTAAILPAIRRASTRRAAISPFTTSTRWTNWFPGRWRGSGFPCCFWQPSRDWLWPSRPSALTASSRMERPGAYTRSVSEWRSAPNGAASREWSSGTGFAWPWPVSSSEPALSL
jgi:predicted permease